MKVRESARLLYNSNQGVWEVHIGVTIPYRGQLWGAELFCNNNKIPISNRGEINRIKTGNMPVQEMML